MVIKRKAAITEASPWPSPRKSARTTSAAVAMTPLMLPPPPPPLKKRAPMKVALPPRPKACFATDTIGRKTCLAISSQKILPLTAEGVTEIDYKDLATLKAYVTETGKIVPSRVTGTKAVPASAGFRGQAGPLPGPAALQRCPRVRGKSNGRHFAGEGSEPGQPG